jgi:hypothetical protein
MKYGALIAILVPGVAAAQPGGSDLPAGGMPAPPPQEMQPQPAQPQPAQPQPPQNAPTRATFVSTGEQRWDVWIDQQPACATPCSIGIMPLQFVVLRSQERNPIRLDVGYMPAGDLMVTAKPLANGMYATGIVFTTFSGMALATGITLTAVGCSTDRDGMCTAGLVTGVAGAVGLYGSIYLMRKALPKATIGPAQPYFAGSQVGVAGTF